jgi:hypothetical protein
MPANVDAPSRNDGVTMRCGVCGRGFRPAGRRRYCSDACRQAAFRRRRPPSPVPLPSVAPGTARSSRSVTVYECPACEARYVGEQRCAECGVFCRRIGPGGHCPHCDEPVAVADLIAPERR